MLTLFTLPKPFRGDIDVIQRNAIGSWLKLDPRLQIILFGDEHGAGEVARELAVEHAPAIACNEYGTPLLDGVFASARTRALYPLLCYVNTDVILLSDFLKAARVISAADGPLLMIGQCWDLDVDTLLDFARPDWEQNVRATLEASGRRRGPFNLDYHLFTRGLYDRIPPFAVGRSRYDNWLIWRARRSRARVVDATRLVEAIHQTHGYAHISGGLRQTLRGPEARRNQQLAGIWCSAFHLFSVLDATHELTPEGVRKRAPRGAVFRQFWLRSRLYLAERRGARHHDLHRAGWIRNRSL